MGIPSYLIRTMELQKYCLQQCLSLFYLFILFPASSVVFYLVMTATVTSFWFPSNSSLVHLVFLLCLCLHIFPAFSRCPLVSHSELDIQEKDAKKMLKTFKRSLFLLWWFCFKNFVELQYMNRKMQSRGRKGSSKTDCKYSGSVSAKTIQWAILYYIQYSVLITRCKYC